MAQTMLRDVPGAMDRAMAQVNALASKLGIDPKIVIGYVNNKAHFPQTLKELTDWGNDPTNNPYGVRRRDEKGGWSPIIPGVTPGKEGEMRPNGTWPGFAHNITNAEDTELQPFTPTEASGDIYGGSFDPAYNAAHPGQTANGAAALGQGPRMQTQGVNPYAGTPYAATWELANPGGGGGIPDPSAGGTVTTTPQGSPADPGGGPYTAQAGGLPGGDGRTALVDANAYGNTQTLQAQIDKAIRDYAIARTAEERQAAYLDLQRWQTELGKVQNQQKTVTDMATAVMSAATSLGSRPADYVKFDQSVSGGRDILDRISGQGAPTSAFGGPTGRIQPGSVWDLLGKLGIQYPQTPATPAGVQPGAPFPSNPALPPIPVPGSAGVPGALQPGAGTAAPGATATSLPAHAQRLAELDKAAGGSWGGNRNDPNATADAWWSADPVRRGKPRPAG